MEERSLIQEMHFVPIESIIIRRSYMRETIIMKLYQADILQR